MNTEMNKRETIEMADGRVYFSDDNWQTVWLRSQFALDRHRGKAIRVTDKEEADLVRFLMANGAAE